MPEHLLFLGVLFLCGKEGIVIGKSKNLKYVLNNLDKVFEMSKNGYSKAQIAKHFGVSRQTFYEYEKSEPAISEIIKNGRSVVIDDIKSAMLKRAVGFQYEEKRITTQKIEYDDGEEAVPAKLIKTEVVTKTAMPDTAAALILLQHWDLDENGSTKWSRDPSSKEIKEKELELKKKQIEASQW